MSKQLTEEQIWEEVETWVNSLMEEGYDLSEYTWEEMYESYVTESWGALGRAALGSLGRGARPVVGGALRQAGKWGTIAGLAGIGDELLSRGAGRTALSKGLEQTRKLGPALRGEPTDSKDSSDTAKPAPSTGKVVSAAGGKGGKVTSGTKYAATLDGKKGNVTYDDSGKKSFTADSYRHNDAFDLVLEYLLSQGHTDTLEEALYVMMEMNAETIQSIVEGYVELNKKRQSKMTDQAMRHMSKGGDDDWEKAYKIEDQRDTKTPEVSKSKEAANRARGMAKRRSN